MAPDFIDRIKIRHRNRKASESRQRRREQITALKAERDDLRALLLEVADTVASEEIPSRQLLKVHNLFKKGWLGRLEKALRKPTNG